MPEVPFSYSYEEGCQRQNVAYTIMHKETFTGYEYIGDFLNLKAYANDGFRCF